MKTKKKTRRTSPPCICGEYDHADGACFRGPSFKVSSQDYLLIAEIAKRGIVLAHKLGAGSQYDCTSLSMDITACHANGCPLRLAELLKADDGNFGHDVFGINRYINRDTGKLTDCFLPRFYDSKAAKRVA